MMSRRLSQLPVLGLGLGLALALLPMEAHADWHGGWHGGWGWGGGFRGGVFIGGWPGYGFYAPYYYPPAYYYPAHPYPYIPAVYPPPPPPPAYGPTPAAAPAPLASQGRNFRVFFDFDKASLTTDGARVVRQAADAYRRGRAARIEVTGYTDLSGTSEYNMDLSKRRADAVRSALTADGVPASAINERWRGKDNPLVATANGVREARNRRVDIVLP